MEKELTRYALKSDYIEKVVGLCYWIPEYRVISARHGKGASLC